MDNNSLTKIWHLISISIAPDVEETVTSILFDLGTTGTVTLEEEESNLKLGAYFDESTKPETLARQIEAELARAEILSSLHSLAFSEIPEQDWMQKWKDGFEPIKIGKRLIVAPSWKKPEDTEGRL